MIGRWLTLFAVGAALTFLSACGERPPPINPPPFATQWRINAGASSSAQAFQGLQFYPQTITVNAGDVVTWTFASAEFHTVTFLGRGQATPPPPTDPNAAKPAGGTTYDGSTYTSSGFLSSGAPYSLTFTKPGTYTYYCILHQPEMLGTIVVNATGTAYPTTFAAYSSQATAQASNDLQAAAASVAQFPYTPGGMHLAAGISPGLAAAAPARSTVLRFLVDTNVADSTLAVPVGSTVTWTNQANNAPHTVTFPIAGQPLPTLPNDPFTPPIGGSTYDGTQLTNSGVLLPGQNYSLTFTKPGTFVYYCLFDDAEGMIGTIIVH
jgi:plastocyanin